MPPPPPNPKKKQKERFRDQLPGGGAGYKNIYLKHLKANEGTMQALYMILHMREDIPSGYLT